MACISPVELLRRQYLQLLEPGHLILPDQKLLKVERIQREIYESLFAYGSLQYEPPKRYRFRVLKRIIAALEAAVENPDQDVCNTL